MRRSRTFIPCGVPNVVSDEDEAGAAAPMPGSTHDTASSLRERADAQAAAAVAAALTDPEQLEEVLAVLRARAEAELQASLKDLTLSVEVQCDQVSNTRACAIPLPLCAACVARCGGVIDDPRDTHVRCAQLKAGVQALSRCRRSAHTLCDVAADVADLCQVRYALSRNPLRVMTAEPLTAQEMGLGSDDQGQPHLRLLQQLGAAQANTNLVVRCVGLLQRDLPSSLTALQSRIASADSGSPTAADELEALYTDLAQLDAQGLMAAATLEGSHVKGEREDGQAMTSARAASVRVAMQHIAAEITAAWTQLRGVMLSHMRQHHRLGRTRPQLLVRVAQLAEMHDAVAAQLRVHTIQPGVMHAEQVVGQSGGAMSLAQACAAAVRQAFADQCDAALLLVSAAPPPQSSLPSAAAASAASAHAGVLDDSPQAVAHALARVDAVLLAHSTFETVTSKCFPPRWKLNGDVHSITENAITGYLTAMAASAPTLSSDDLLRVLAWVDAVEPNQTTWDGEAGLEVTVSLSGPVSQPMQSDDDAFAGPYATALRPVKEEYLRRCGIALRRWVANILANSAAPTQGGPTTSLSSAPVDIFRLIHEQQAVVAQSGAASRLAAPLAFMHLDILDGYAASLVAQGVVMRDAKGDLCPGAMEKLLTTCNDAHAAARNTEENFQCTDAVAPRRKASLDSLSETGPASPCDTPTSVCGSGGPFAQHRRMSSGCSWMAQGTGTALDGCLIAERAASLVTTLDGVSRGCVYRLCEVIYWDVESVLWRCFAPDRWAKSTSTGGAKSAVPSALRSALATLEDYVGDLSMALLPPLVEALLTECVKRGAVTYASLLLTGPPLVAQHADDAAGAACVGDDIVEAARLCIAADIHAFRSCLEALHADVAVIEAASEMLTVTCELATAAGAATAQRTAACVRLEYGHAALPASLLNRVAKSGCWSSFGASLTFTDAPPGTESGLGGILPAMLQQVVQAPLQSVLRKGKAAGRRMSVMWAADAEADADEAASHADETAAEQSAQRAPRSMGLRRSPGLMGNLSSFKYIDEDSHGPQAASSGTLRATFFHRVEALCVKRGLGARPRDVAWVTGEDYALPPDLTGPWTRLGALKRRATLWPWSAREPAEPVVESEAATSGKRSAEATLPRRKTLFF